MRGALDGTAKTEGFMRITPAHAGSTQLLLIYLLDIEDHPRACGEHCGKNRHEGKCLGSPPRMRGAPAVREVDPVDVRITPAHAGSTPDHRRD